ncbi:MAG: hypothetical protein Q7R95_00695, partial [bacterium]|nr:hypothetical protein [bacterium]
EILITNEPRGVSGHIDHVTISMVTSYVFNKLPSAKTILYHCISEEYRKQFPYEYFIYLPPGYKKSEIDKVVDVSSVWTEKVNAILSHKSQSKDAQRILNRINNFRKEEYFLVKNK